mgnify:CR=1 FL=1
MVEGDTVYADFVKEHGYGVHHFGVLVEDMEEAIAQAEAAGGDFDAAEATLDAIEAVVRFALTHDSTLEELDINPLMVLEKGKGSIAADALVRMR